MEETVSRQLVEFLSESEHYISQADNLQLETATELYDMFEVAAKVASDNINVIDPELRVKICDGKEAILDRIVDIGIGHSTDLSNLSIYTPAVQGYRRWANVELMKDKGLAGYTLAREIGAKAVMYYGTRPSDYPNLADIPEMLLLYSNDKAGNAEAYKKHLLESYSDMDVLILHGMYNETMGYLDAYRKLRPDGKVFCGLDMNSFWMRNIDWGSSSVREFSDQCDVIATSCRALRDALNRNPAVSFPCYWLPNGLFSLPGRKTLADPQRKENIILTVGRVGSAQKNNAELLVAFARVSDRLAGWKLHLVGSIEPEFKPLIEEFFKQRPDLKERVVFRGAIADKDALFKEYEKAKIFALTSKSEGGTPNVYAEALFHGCMFVTSDIDAADEITNFGDLGIKYKLGDIDVLSAALVELCKNADKRAFQNHIPKALAYANKYYDWNRNAKKLAYMLFAH